LTVDDPFESILASRSEYVVRFAIVACVIVIGRLPIGGLREVLYIIDIAKPREESGESFGLIRRRQPSDVHSQRSIVTGRSVLKFS
jgi:hypothetical protein